MTWTDEDPGAGDLDALWQLAGRLDTAAHRLSEVRWEGWRSASRSWAR